ncbi:MAG: leucine-rich repeat protein [Clostridia bacterium]|nr:leucine-rich repeat protein [Clostridia bacterium]
MKKLILFILILSAAVILSVSAFADGSEISWTYDEETGELIISGEGGIPSGYEQKKGNEALNAIFPHIRKVTVTEGITGLGHSFFIRCGSLAEVRLPDTLTTLGNNAFSGCKALKYVRLSDNLTVIGSFTFYGCTGLEDIVLPEKLERIDSYAFSGCTSLKSVTMRDDLAAIGHSAFEGCVSLPAAEIPASVETIGVSAFEDCTALSKVGLSSGLKEICQWAFYNCPELTEISFPDSIESIGEGAFMKCTSLSEINMPDAAVKLGPSVFTFTKWYDDQPDGFVFAGKTLYAYKGRMPEHSSIEIPEGTKAVADQCFMLYDELETVNIPASVEYIGSRVFYGCHNISEINVDGENRYYTSREGIVYSKDMTAIERMPEGKTTGTFTVPDTVDTICETAFRGCETLKSVSIPKSVTLIGDHAFFRCEALEKVYYEGSEEEWKNITIKEGNGPLLEAKVYFNGETDSDVVISFEDVPENCWFYDAVKKCFAKGYMIGTGDNIFSPDMELTRAQTVQILAKVAGAELDGIVPSGGFADVPENAWYAQAVEWAVRNGVTIGTGGGRFSPDDPVTREQLAVFLKAAAKMLGVDTSTDMIAFDYTDNDQISPWAADAVRWAISAKLMTGTTGTTISPGAAATRAQTAVIIAAFLENINS